MVIPGLVYSTNLSGDFNLSYNIRMSELECVGFFSNKIEAELFKATLEGDGIVATILVDDIGGMYPGVGGARVLVKREDLEKAKVILKEIEE